MAESTVCKNADHGNDIAHDHGHGTASISRGLIRSEGLRTDDVTSRPTNVEPGIQGDLLCMAGHIGLVDGDESNVWCPIGVKNAAGGLVS